MTLRSICATPALVGTLILGAAAAAAVHGQAGRRQTSHVTIPFLANATRPADLEFEGGSCEADRTGTTLTCQFQQLFLTTSGLAPQTCLVTTNRYDRTFKKESDTRWVSSGAPEGDCGVVEVTTLQDDGGVRWTMDTRHIVTRKAASALCRSMAEPTERLSWQNTRRALPCTFIQPGGLMP